jgi:hypothetical protein
VTNNNEISEEIFNNAKETIGHSDINYTVEEKNLVDDLDNAFNYVNVEEKVNIINL